MSPQRAGGACAGVDTVPRPAEPVRPDVALGRPLQRRRILAGRRPVAGSASVRVRRTDIPALFPARHTSYRGIHPRSRRATGPADRVLRRSREPCPVRGVGRPGFTCGTGRSIPGRADLRNIVAFSRERLRDDFAVASSLVGMAGLALRPQPPSTLEQRGTSLSRWLLHSGGIYDHLSYLDRSKPGGRGLPDRRLRRGAEQGHVAVVAHLLAHLRLAASLAGGASCRMRTRAPCHGICLSTSDGRPNGTISATGTPYTGAGQRPATSSPARRSCSDPWSVLPTPTSTSSGPPSRRAVGHHRSDDPVEARHGGASLQPAHGFHLETLRSSPVAASGWADRHASACPLRGAGHSRTGGDPFVARVRRKGGPGRRCVGQRIPAGGRPGAFRQPALPHRSARISTSRWSDGFARSRVPAPSRAGRMPLRQSSSR